MHTPSQTTELSHGAVLRWATPADAAAYGALAEHAFVIGADHHINPNVRTYAHDLTSDNHPFCQSGTVAVVTLDNALVAAAALMKQPFSYAGVPIPVGRPELVCSHSDVRQRGYVRAIMHRLHDASTARGDLMQVITGIPHYYHQFGYTWAIDYNGFCRIEVAKLPPLTDAHPKVTLRPFERHDYDLFRTLYERDLSARKLTITTPYPEELFAHSLGKSLSTEGFRAYGIYNPEGACIGFCLMTLRNWDGSVSLMALGYSAEGSHYIHSLPVLHAVHAIAQTLPKPIAAHPDYHAIDILEDGNHPIAAAMSAISIAHTHIKPYTWYVRIPDMPRMLLHIRSVLEERIAESPLRGYTGNVEVTFYRNGITMEWRDGVLVDVKHRPIAAYGDAPQAGYPYTAFCQLVCGWRSSEELREWYPDIWSYPNTTVLLDILFPKVPTQLLWMN